MRLPADATLIVVDAPPSGAPGAPPAMANLAALIAAWRAEALPLAHAFSPARGGGPEALEGEIVVAMSAASAFAGTALESRLDAIGATTLVVCGAADAVVATAREAGALGYQVFVVADACPSAGDSEGPALAGLSRELATPVDAASALSAAAAAKARLRWQAERARDR